MKTVMFLGAMLVAALMIVDGTILTLQGFWDGEFETRTAGITTIGIAFILMHTSLLADKQC